GEAEEAGESAEGNFVYRGLAEGEDPTNGLRARAPDVEADPISHVAGLKRSPWISASKSLDIAMNKYGAHGVVKIDLSKVKTTVIDLSGGIGEPGMHNN